jgi:hypothetical protein
VKAGEARLPSAEPIGSLDFGLPIIANYRVVDDRYLIGFDQGYTQGKDALLVFDMSNPLEPREVIRWEWGDEMGDCYLQFDGDYAYKHCNGSDKLSAVALSDLLHPVFLPSRNAPFVFDEFIVHQGLMYTLQNDDFRNRSTLDVWDLTNFEEIRQLDSLQIPKMGRDLLIHKGYLLFRSLPRSAYGSYGIYVVDVSDPKDVKIVDEYAGENDDRGGYILKLKGDYLYAVQDDIGLRIIDVSDPSRPHQVSKDDKRNWVVRDMEIADDFLYMVGDFRFRIVDVSNPQRPLLVMETDLRAYDIAVINEYVYILKSLGEGTFVYQTWSH